MHIGPLWTGKTFKSHAVKIVTAPRPEEIPKEFVRASHSDLVCSEPVLAKPPKMTHDVVVFFLWRYDRRRRNGGRGRAKRERRGMKVSGVSYCVHSTRCIEILLVMTLNRPTVMLRASCLYLHIIGTSRWLHSSWFSMRWYDDLRYEAQASNDSRVHSPRRGCWRHCSLWSLNPPIASRTTVHACPQSSCVHVNSP
jgi:hypothetical protein